MKLDLQRQLILHYDQVFLLSSHCDVLITKLGSLTSLTVKYLFHHSMPKFASTWYWVSQTQSVLELRPLPDHSSPESA